MTLDEAIELFRSDVSTISNKNTDYIIAEWLEELKVRKKFDNQDMDLLDAHAKGYKDGYNQALYDLWNIAISKYDEILSLEELDECIGTVRRIRMTIDEAIEDEKKMHEFSDYQNYHKQLAELLEELKAIKEMDLYIPQHFTKEQSDWIKAYCIKRNKEFYNQAIEEFIKTCDEHAKFDMKKHPQNAYCLNRLTLLKIAEQLKGDKNDN